MTREGRQIEIGNVRLRDLARHGEHWHLFARPDVAEAKYRVLHISSRQLTVQDLLRKELHRQLNIELAPISSSEFFHAIKFLFERVEGGAIKNAANQ